MSTKKVSQFRLGDRSGGVDEAVSTLAKQTYVDAGVSPEKVSVVPVDAGEALFKPREAGQIDVSQRFGFIFVHSLPMIILRTRDASYMRGTR